MPRKRERVPVSLKIVLEWTSGKREARISDLSMSGCFVDTIVHVNMGETASFKLTALTGEWLHLSGTVVYYLPSFGFGLSFEAVSKEQEILLEQIVSAHGGNPWGYGDLSSGRVIIVDDDATNLHLITQTFQAEGCAIVRVNNGREAYLHLQSDNDFIAVIFNVSRDKIQALNLVNYMKAEKRLQHILVIIIMKTQDFQIEQVSLSAGADILIKEPFTSEQMRDAARAIIQRKKVR